MQNEVAETALITGASSGIGLELAKLFAADRINVVLIARTREKLEALAGELQSNHSIRATVIAADLALASSPDEIFRKTKEQGLHIDYLVNNAGFGIRESFHRNDLNDIVEMLQVNVTALTYLTRLYLESMLERRRGRILNVASTAAFQPGPWMAVYYASKAYVLSLSEALHKELQGTGVSVTTLCPGPTPTGFQERAGAKNIQLMKSKLMRVTDATTVAKEGYEGMMKNKTIIIPGLMNRVLATGAQVGPRWVATSIAGSLNKSK